MPPFTKPRKLQQNSNEFGEYEPEICTLALAKMCKLSFEELNQLTADDFLDLVEILIPNEDEERQGTQSDIDTFF